MTTAVISMYQVQANNYEIRMETYMGRKHLIVPVVMMVEGVHCGSAGPLFHSIEELGKYPDSWNGIPVSIQHPEQDGQYISANSPEVLERQTVGQVFNTFVDGNKLKAECWIDIERIIAISPEAYSYLQNKRPLEVSIGVFSDDIPQEGDWNGEHYIAIATNHRPDHLALLPGGRGACSWADGAGIRANSMKKGGEPVDIPATIKDLVCKGYGVLSYQNNEGFRSIMSQIQDVLNGYDTDLKLHYLSEVYEDFFVYEVNSRINSETYITSVKYYKRPYSVNEDGKVVFGDTTTEVMRKIVYDEVKTNSKYRRKDDVKVDKAKMDILVQSGVFSEADQEWLTGLDAERLDKLVTACTKKVETPQANEAKVDIPTVIQALAEQFKTPEQYIQLMPEEMRDQMESGLKLHREQRQAVIDKIKAFNVFSEEELQKKSMDELNKISKLIPTPRDYSLAGAKSVNTNTETEEVLLPLGLKA